MGIVDGGRFARDAGSPSEIRRDVVRLAPGLVIADATQGYVCYCMGPPRERGSVVSGRRLGRVRQATARVVSGEPGA